MLASWQGLYAERISSKSKGDFSPKSRSAIFSACGMSSWALMCTAEVSCQQETTGSIAVTLNYPRAETLHIFFVFACFFQVIVKVRNGQPEN